MKLFWGFVACMLTLTSYAQYSCQHYNLNATAWSWPYSFSEGNGYTYFVAESDTSGPGLWRFSNGVVENVSGMLQPAPSSISRYTRPMPYIDGKVYFIQTNHNNGTYLLRAYTEATKTLSTIAISLPGFKQVADVGLVVIGNRLYFVGQHVDKSGEIICYDPVSGKMEQITNFKDLKDHAGASQLTDYNGMIAFRYASDAGGFELGILDIAARKVYIYDILPGILRSTPDHFTVHNGKLYFSAATSQREQLYSYTPATGPVRLTDTTQIPFAPYGFSNLYAYKDAIIFATLSMAGAELYRYNIGPRTVTHLGFFSGFNGAAVYGDKLFMSIDSNHSGELYVYDGVHPMQHISKFFSAPDLKQCYDLTVANNKLFFAGSLVAPFSDIQLNVLSDSSLVGINDIAVMNEAVVYPNPAYTEAHISFTLKQNSTLSIALTDIQGRTVYTEDVKKYAAGRHEITIPVAALSPGVYFYAVKNGEGGVVWSGKLMKD